MLVFAFVCCQTSTARAGAPNVESGYCLYTDLPGWLGLKTGVQDIAFMWLFKTIPLSSVGLNAWHWYDDDVDKYYKSVVRGVGAVPAAFNAWEVNGTFEMIVPNSYMHLQWPPWKEFSLFKPPNSSSFSGWVFGASPGVTAFIPGEKGFHVDVFGTLSPYTGLQLVLAQHVFLGVRLGYQFAGQLQKESFVDRIEQKWFASLLFGIAGR